MGSSSRTFVLDRAVAVMTNDQEYAPKGTKAIDENDEGVEEFKEDARNKMIQEGVRRRDGSVECGY